MQIDIGSVYDGIVTGLTKFGAFVKLEDGTTGMVHISEVSNEYVNDISEHLAEGDKVKVKVIEINEKGKASLSIKKATDEELMFMMIHAIPRPKITSLDAPEGFVATFLV